MKKIFKTIVSLFLCTLFLFNFAACNDNKPYSASDIYDLLSPSVGEVITYNSSGKELSLGTCFVSSSNGNVITNYHVIDGAAAAKITINGNSYAVDKVLSYDKNIDLAVLHIESNDLVPATISSSPCAVGSTVYAFGSSKGLTATFSQGIVTYADREIDGVHYVQHDAAISNGNSGGPLIDERGHVVGINTMTVKDSQNLNFAISTSELAKLSYDSPLTFSQFYEKESDVFTKVKNFVIQKGTYDSTDKEYSFNLGYAYSSDYTTKYLRKICYNVTDDELRIMLFIDADYLFTVFIDEVDGVYIWTYYDFADNYMLGTLYATTYTSSSLLGYSHNNVSSSSLRSTIRELASLMANVLFSYITTDFAEINVSAADLGFIYF